MSEYTPLNNPINAISVVAKRSPNAYNHVAVHPAVFSYAETSFIIAALGTQKIQWLAGPAPSSGYSEIDFALYPRLDIWLDVTQLGDLLLLTSNFPSFAGISREENRWALNIGLNLINYRPLGRYGRFEIVNRSGGSSMTA
ncbi:MAG: hypothetical protein L0Z48_10720, partial [candidate division Zixibacteria bacterium]|nr:hypothetical protein [candidate division Zixibacteria bacterium]